MVRKPVEARVEWAANLAFVDWLYDQLCESDRVAAPDGECEAYEFGAVNPLPGGVTVPWQQFNVDPVGALSRLFSAYRPEVSPVVLAEYDVGEHAVSLRLGRHVAAERALPGAVLLG